MINLFETQKTFYLCTTTSELIAVLRASFSYDFWRFRLYVKEVNGNILVLSNKGMIETKISVYIDEPGKKVMLQTDTVNNYFFFAGLTLFFLLVMWLPGHIELTWQEIGMILGLEMLSLFLFLAIDRWYAISKVIKVLAANQLIE